jgi:hypothetical protein
VSVRGIGLPLSTRSDIPAKEAELEYAKGSALPVQEDREEYQNRDAVGG